MKVYVVERWIPFEYLGLVGVFSSVEKADEYIRNTPRDWEDEQFKTIEQDLDKKEE